MFTRIKNGVTRLIAQLEQLAQKAGQYLGPALKVGKIITAFYSVYAVTVAVGSGILGYSLSWLTDYPGADFVMEILAMISMATLVLSGSIVEALMILLWGLEAGISLASLGFDSLIGLAISAVLFVLPVMIAILVVIIAPIIPILMHQFRKSQNDTTYT